MTHRRLMREMDMAEFAEWHAVYLVEAEMSAEPGLRASLEAEALAGLKARMGKRKRG